MPNSDGEGANAQQQIENLKAAMREITHEISNPIGVLRMAAYFLESGDTAPGKKEHYIGLINESLDKIELQLKRLKALRENPTKTIDEIPNPLESPSSPGAPKS